MFISTEEIFISCDIIALTVPEKKQTRKWNSFRSSIISHFILQFIGTGILKSGIGDIIIHRMCWVHWPETIYIKTRTARSNFSMFIFFSLVFHFELNNRRNRVKGSTRRKENQWKQFLFQHSSPLLPCILLLLIWLESHDNNPPRTLPDERLPIQHARELGFNGTWGVKYANCSPILRPIGLDLGEANRQRISCDFAFKLLAGSRQFSGCRAASLLGSGAQVGQTACCCILADRPVYQWIIHKGLEQRQQRFSASL